MRRGPGTLCTGGLPPCLDSSSLSDCWTGGENQTTGWRLPPTVCRTVTKRWKRTGPPIRHHVHWEAMQAEYMLDQQLGRLLGQGELWEGDKMGHLAEPVNDSEYDCVTVGAGQAGDEVHRDVGPWMTRNREGLQEPRWGLAGVFVLIADDKGLDVLSSIIVQGRPPKSLTK